MYNNINTIKHLLAIIKAKQFKVYSLRLCTNTAECFGDLFKFNDRYYKKAYQSETNDLDMTVSNRL